MAQSPEDNASRTEIIRYDRGWNAINAMLRSGRSLSGHERNCCFLNTGGERFADISGAAGLDFPDDGRVLATADWDYDGDIDFWVANRSGPQVRYLQNNLRGTDSSASANFVAFRLEGVNCNRDAIGARVIIETDGGPAKSMQTLRAGEGYLSQSSKWIHFGTGSATALKKVTIRWPHGKQQVFENVAANQRYTIREGAEPTRWKTARMASLAASDLKSIPVSDKARIVLLAPVPLPNLQGLDPTGESISLTDASEKPRLVNLWASWCDPCLEELADWRDHASELSDAGLTIVGLNVDQADDQREKVPTVVSELNLPFKIAYADEELAAKFDVIQRSLLSRQRPLPIPSSFLIDGDGQLRAVYKGPVSVDVLLNDAKLLTADRREILAAATPFPGKWIEPPGGSTPLQLTMKLLDGGFADDAEAYLGLLASQNSPHLTASLTNLLGAVQVDKKKYQAAADSFERSLKLDPADRQAHIELGGLLLSAKQGKRAQPHFESVLAATPNDPELIFSLGMSLMMQGQLDEASVRFQQALRFRPLPLAHWHLAEIAIAKKNAATAISEYEAAIKLKPKLISGANNLAWLLATTPEENVRNATRAKQVAEAVVKSAPAPTLQGMDTLAAAYAAAGEFEKATSAAETAIRLAEKEKPDEVEVIRKRLQLYQKKQSYRESL